LSPGRVVMTDSKRARSKLSLGKGRLKTSATRNSTSPSRRIFLALRSALATITSDMSIPVTVEPYSLATSQAVWPEPQPMSRTRVSGVGAHISRSSLVASSPPRWRAGMTSAMLPTKSYHSRVVISLSPVINSRRSFQRKTSRPQFSVL